MTAKYQAPAVKKAFQILKLISNTNQGLGISELAKTLGISKGTVHGVTSILEELGMITRDPATKKYELGLTLFELGRHAYSQIDLREIARPIIENLMEKIQETVFLGVLNGDHVTILDNVECRHDFKITSPIGATIPLFASATGKALLAVMEEEIAREIIRTRGLPRYTDRSITDPDQFLAEIRMARQRGYATDYEEYIAGVRAVAAPIDENRNRLSAIWVVGFKASLDDSKMKALEKEIRKATEDINQKLHEASREKVHSRSGDIS
ncbi:MAG: IclR family transcriptional regulator [Deltaproteobacteria bacterium]|nr:IclR family transcriptional regulator [Deltaproteobacteria bacterium]